jgi:hypothetical protein
MSNENELEPPPVDPPRPFCKFCKHWYTRPVEEWQQYCADFLYNNDGTLQHPSLMYNGCDHPVARQASNQFVSVYQMRMLGHPCSAEGLLYEHSEEKVRQHEEYERQLVRDGLA